MVGQKGVLVMQMVWGCIICIITCIFVAIVEDMIDKSDS